MRLRVNLLANQKAKLIAPWSTVREMVSLNVGEETLKLVSGPLNTVP
jgi:hypothetical protein